MSPLQQIQTQLANLNQSPVVFQPRLYQPGQTVNYAGVPGIGQPFPTYWQPAPAAPVLTAPTPTTGGATPPVADVPNYGDTGPGGSAPGPAGVGPTSAGGAAPTVSGTGLSNGVANAVGNGVGLATGISGLGLLSLALNSAINMGAGAINSQALATDAQNTSQVMSAENVAINNAIAAIAAQGGETDGPATAAPSAPGNPSSVGTTGAAGSDGTGGEVSDSGGDGGGGGGGGGCFLSTAITRGTGRPDDAAELEVMRAFRDHVLMKDPKLRDLVLHYYEVAPKVVKALDRRPDADELYQHLREQFLMPGVKHVLAGDVPQALKTYADLLRFVGPLSRTPAGDRMADGAGQVSDQLQGQGYAKGGPVSEEVLGGALGALRRLAQKTKSVSGTLPEVIGEESKNLPSVISNPTENGSFTDLANRAAELPMTRRGLLGRAASAAARNVLPDLGALEEAASPLASVGRQLVKPAAPQVGSFEETALPAIIKIFKDLKENPAVQKSVRRDWSVPDYDFSGVMQHLSKSKPGVVSPEAALAFQEAINANISGDVARAYGINLTSMRKLSRGLSKYLMEDDPDAGSIPLSWGLDKALKVSGYDPSVDISKTFGSTFPKLQRLDIGKVDAALSSMTGESTLARLNSSNKIIKRSAENDALDLRDLMAKMPASEVQTLLDQHAENLRQLLPLRNQSLNDRASTIQQLRALRTLRDEVGPAEEHRRFLDDNLGYAKGGPINFKRGY